MPRLLYITLPLGFSLLLTGLCPSGLGAQEKSKEKDKSASSPVFRNYRPPPDAPPVQESDALRQIWYAFLAARKANAGDMMAQQELAVRYLYGKGVERDTAKAAYWMLKAAEQGMVTAKFDAAIMAFHGWGMPWDPFPSQIMENWAFEPEVLRLYARHYATGDVIPAALAEKITRSDKFNQGFETVEYLAASLLDMDWHTLTSTEPVDANSFETRSIQKMRLIPEIISRYRSPYFAHIWSSGYSAGYYSYIWAAVLDADAFEAFKEHGLFDRTTAKAFEEFVLAKGATDEAMKQYMKFRGKEPAIEPLLKRRGLMEER